ncbi:MAG: DUF4292 domain-containing protein [Bacteroidota bacterium]
MLKKHKHSQMVNSYLKRFFLPVFFVLMLLVSCGSSKSIIADGTVNEKLTAKQLIKENKKRDASFRTLQARVKIAIFQEGKEQGYTVSLRMEKDKTIWLNATLGLARAKITPEQVQFYDKLNNQFFEGDYSLISDLLGIELNFDQLQNLLLGEPIFDLKSNDYEISNNEASYILAPENQNPLLELFLLFNPSHLKMDSQQLSQALKKRFLQIDYPDYQKVEEEVLPKNITIIAVEENEEIKVELEYKSVNLDQDLRFPFNIPSGFKEIILEDAK